MSRRSAKVSKYIRAFVRSSKTMRGTAKAADRVFSQLHHGLANIVPTLISPTPRQLTIAVTAFCNLRCVGCNYGRDFMNGQQLSWAALKGVLDDARWAGIETVRFYGGEPLLHPRLADAVSHAVTIGLKPYVTTNGLLLRQKIDALYAAGLRLVTIGFYGEEEHYDSYTQRPGRFRLLTESLSYVREKYGADLELQLNYVLLKPTGSVAAVDDAWDFARRFQMHLHVDLGGNSIPFFNTGDGEALTFTEADRPRLNEVARHLAYLKRQHPTLLVHSEAFLASIPDWMILGRDMRVACDAYELVWLGADGSVQLCDVTFPLGNINVTPLRDILFTPEHGDAARRAFKLDCPNCTCKVETRIQSSFQSYRKYSACAKSLPSIQPAKPHRVSP